MLTVICSYVVASRLKKESIYTLKLARRGEAVSRFGNVQSLASVTVREVMTTEFKAFLVSDTVSDLETYIRDGKTINFPVLDGEGRFYGLLSTEMFRRAFFSDKKNSEIHLSEITITDIAVLFPGSSLLEAVEAFAFRDVEAIPVVGQENTRELVGMLYRHDVENEYKRQNLIHTGEARS